MKKYILVDAIHKNTNSYEVVLRINKICNQKCIFCFVDIDQTSFFSYEEIKKELNSIIKNYKGKKCEFVLTGGEPTLHPDFIKIVSYLYKKGEYIRVQSNGVFFASEKNMKKILPYIDKIDFFISFHSHNEKVYNFLTGSSHQYTFAIKGIQNLLQYTQIEINIVLTAFNTKLLPKYFYFLGKTFENIKNLRINISLLTNIYKYSYAKKLLVSYSDIIYYINQSEKIIKKYSISLSPSFGAPGELPFCIAKSIFYYDHKKYTESRFLRDRKKIETCKKCDYNQYCNGVLALYIETFGDSEIQAINKNHDL